jgi:hypothetical protein
VLPSFSWAVRRCGLPIAKRDSHIRESFFSLFHGILDSMGLRVNCHNPWGISFCNFFVDIDIRIKVFFLRHFVLCFVGSEMIHYGIKAAESA